MNKCDLLEKLIRFANFLMLLFYYINHIFLIHCKNAHLYLPLIPMKLKEKTEKKKKAMNIRRILWFNQKRTMFSQFLLHLLLHFLIRPLKVSIEMLSNQSINPIKNHLMHILVEFRFRYQNDMFK